MPYAIVQFRKMVNYTYNAHWRNANWGLFDLALRFYLESVIHLISAVYRGPSRLADLQRGRDYFASLWSNVNLAISPRESHLRPDEDTTTVDRTSIAR